MAYSGQAIRVNCKRCGKKMLEWELSPLELETKHPFPFDKICGHCLTTEEVEFNRNTGLTMAYEIQINGVFTYNSTTKKFNKFAFTAEGGVVGWIYFPKDNVRIPSRLTLNNEMRDEIEKKIEKSEE